MTLTDLALLLFFIGIIIIKNYVIIYCFTETNEESPEDFYLIISIICGVLLIAMLVIVIGCLAKHGQLTNVLCCGLIWWDEERTLMQPVDIVSQLTIQDKKGPSHEERQEMLPVFRKKTQWQ